MTRTAVAPLRRHRFVDNGAEACLECGLGEHQGRAAAAHAPVEVSVEALAVSHRMVGEPDDVDELEPAGVAETRVAAPAMPSIGVHLDWSSRGPDGSAAVGEPKPCGLCGKDALLRDPVTGKPTHKVCVERRLTEQAEGISARTDGGR